MKNERKLDPQIKYVGIYARVSTQNHGQLNSLANQIDGLIKIVAKDPFMKLVDVYVDVQSGMSSRENLSRMVADCKSGKINYILVKSISRMYRDVVGFLTLTRELKELGVNIHFVNDNIDSISVDGELCMTLIEAVAQAESEEKSKNIKWGLDKAKRNPESKSNNRVIYGYKRTTDGELVINEQEARTIKRIFELYLEGKSVIKIIDILEIEELYPPKGANKWSKESIRKKLSDERYTGMASRVDGGITNMVKLKYPTIIGRSQFNAVQKMKVERSNVAYDSNGKRVRSAKKYTSK